MKDTYFANVHLPSVYGGEPFLRIPSGQDDLIKTRAQGLWYHSACTLHSDVFGREKSAICLNFGAT